MDKIEQIMAKLGEASDSELTEVLAAINEAASAVGPENTKENVDKLSGLLAAKTAVTGEVDARAALASEGDAARSAFATSDADKAAAEEKAAQEKAAQEKADAERTEAEKGKAEEAAAGLEGDTEDNIEGGDAVTASAKLGSISKAAKQSKAVTRQFAGQVTATTKSTGASASASGGVQELSSEALSAMLGERHATLHRSGFVGRQTVARIEFAYPPERQLSREASASANMKKIAAVNSREAITAAGGLCAPLENIYDIDVLGVLDRPVRDALTRFQVDRGGIQYRPAMDALAMTDGLGVWTAEDDAAVSNPPDGTPEKTCAVIECPALDDAVVEAIYLCLQYPNFTARFDPEWVDATTRAALVAHARFSENRLLARLLTGSKLLTAPKAVSAVRDVLVNIDKTVAYYRNRHRLDTMVPLHMILPRWVLDLFRADMARGLGTTYDTAFLGFADSEIMTWFRNRGVNVTFHLDGLAAATVTPPGTGLGSVPQQFYDNAAAGTVIPPFIDKIDSVLFAEGDWLFLDGGTLDLGLVRDSGLNSINRYQTFIEAWEGTAFVGIESLRLLMEVQPTGAVAGTIATSSFVD